MMRKTESIQPFVESLLVDVKYCFPRAEIQIFSHFLEDPTKEYSRMTFLHEQLENERVRKLLANVRCYAGEYNSYRVAQKADLTTHNFILKHENPLKPDSTIRCQCIFCGKGTNKNGPKHVFKAGGKAITKNCFKMADIVEVVEIKPYEDSVVDSGENNVIRESVLKFLSQPLSYYELSEKIPTRKAEISRDDIIELLDIDDDYNDEIKKRVIDLMYRYRDVFSKDPSDYRPVSNAVFDITTDNKEIRGSSKPIPVPVRLRKVAADILDNLCKNGQIYPSRYAKYISSAFLVPKKLAKEQDEPTVDGYRMASNPDSKPKESKMADILKLQVVDYRVLNDALHSYNDDSKGKKCQNHEKFRRKFSKISLFSFSLISATVQSPFALLASLSSVKFLTSMDIKVT